MRSFALLACFAVPAVAELLEHPEHGLRLERGFRIHQFSGEQLANDIWCLTLNPRGEAVVSGPGYISTLLDMNADGKADEAIRFATTKGAMGIAFDPSGKQVLVMGDGWLSEYRDDNLDRVADGPPRHLFPFASGEHGGHAIKRGPDGWWWVIGGNDAGFRADQHDLSRLEGLDPTNRKVRAGALLRISPDLQRSEVVADGFRNPYDFDFNEAGQVFTYDSDCERDYFLPWYSGCRAYHVRFGKTHGWRLPGYLRSFRIPDYMPETVPALADLGRGSPTGVRCYQGSAFPSHYRGGLFICDWTFGRIHYLPLTTAGDTFTTRPEVFLEPIGTHGFAPTAIVETKDGALLVSIGGRKTRGAVYRIEADKNAPNDTPAVLAVAPQSPPAMLAEIAAAQAKLGGWRIEGASAEVFVPYEPANPKGLDGNDRKDALDVAQRGLFSIDDRVQAESARLLAMLADDSPLTADQLLKTITEKSVPTSDFHYLACLARLQAKPNAERTARVSQVILDLDQKLAGGDRRPKQQWPVRLNEVVSRLIEKDATLASALVDGFQRPGQLSLVDALSQPARASAAQRFLELTRTHPDFEWSPELVTLLASLPDARPSLRAQWKQLGLRPALRKALQQNPTAEDTALLAESAIPPVSSGNVTEFTAPLKDVAWDQGDVTRGEKIFNERACATCHAGTSPLGPELSGPVSRLSASDLMTDIQFPNRNVAEAFRATVFTLKDGTQRSGFIVFNSADGVMLQTGPGITERIGEENISAREASPVSLMPPALLSGLKPAELADLYAYLRTLKAN
jgi:putative heme-binding domain-containing protein